MYLKLKRYVSELPKKKPSRSPIAPVKCSYMAIVEAAPPIPTLIYTLYITHNLITGCTPLVAVGGEESLHGQTQAARQ
ncbi:hypothetical protein GCM10007160_25670 [Litchfieldella qijiaojingensis]|uniref:Uncharacterized protein n=1 Tax=Litchfieldella qijiaojingensis TaxID=980347 RepID=A0ABQ2YZ81_9GAMM|nr:hypothetical protein GCM10007160_25670 [Halomonas qijiaojingensis]